MTPSINPYAAVEAIDAPTIPSVGMRAMLRTRLALKPTAGAKTDYSGSTRKVER